MGTTAALVITVVTAVVVAQEQQRYRSEAEAYVLERLHSTRSALAAALNHKLAPLTALAAYVQLEPQVDQDQFAAMAAHLIADQPGVRSVQLAPAGVVTHVFPLQGNEAAMDHDLLADPEHRDATLRAILTREVVLAGPVTLPQGGSGLIARKPIFLAGGAFWGLAIVVVDFDRLADQVGLGATAEHMRISLRGADALGAQGRPFFGDPALFHPGATSVTMAVPGGTWELAGATHGNWPPRSPLAPWLLFSGLALALATGSLVALRHRRAEEMLWYQSLSEHTRDMILFSDGQGRILGANAAALRGYGYSLEEICRLDLDALGIRDGEHVHRRKDGSTFPAEVSLQVKTVAGRRLFTSVIRDITERKQAEDAVRRSEERFAKAFRASPAAMGILALVEPQAVFLDANASLLGLLQRNYGDLVGRSLQELNLLADASGMEALEAAWRQSGSLRDMEVALRTGSGQMRLVSVSAEAIDLHGQQCILFLAHDITAPKRAEALVEGQNRILELVATGAPLAQTLESLSRFVESQSPGTRCSFAPDTEGAAPVISFEGPRQVGAEEQQLFEICTRLAGIAIERARVEDEVRRRARQRAAVVELGQIALAGAGLSHLMDQAVALVAGELEAEFCKVEEKTAADGLICRAAVGWTDADAVIWAEPDRHALYALTRDAPVLLADAAREARFAPPAAFRRHGIVSGAATVIREKDRPYGVLSVHTTRRRTFSGDDVMFLQSVARVLGEAITHQRAEAAQRHSENRFRSAFEHAPVGMALVSLSGQLVQVNQSLCEVLQYPEEELLTLSLRDLLHPEEIESHLDSFLTPGRSLQAEHRCLAKLGHVVWCQSSFSLVRDELDRPMYFIWQMRDVTEQKRFEADLVHLANHDPLTNLFNRRRFQQELQRAVAHAARYGSSGALLFIDLDDFKDINDSLGHQAGDELLIQLAAVLRGRLRRTDILARLGGDEFGILLPVAAAPEAQAVAKDVVDVIGNHLAVLGGQPVRLTASVGIVIFPDQAESERDLLALADLAMYEAKNGGGNRAVLYRPDTNWLAQIDARRTWEHRIRTALAEDRFLLVAQPILDLKSGVVSHHELLLRMIGEDGELIAPGAFLDVAERTGLIRDIDRWVARRAIRLIAERRQGGQEPCLEVNLSGKAFGDPELLSLIRSELQETGVDGRSLIFEITETAAIASFQEARQFANALRRLGCRLALDDFGVGFSSLSHVKHLPVDYLKIDGSFIRNLATNAVDQNLVQAIVAIARAMNQQTIAEYVGDAQTASLLRQYGVDYAQGYYIGKPAPLPA